MASMNKQLLGSETARALRAMGVKSKICGLSANDMEDMFLQNGADAFLMKPLPVAKEPLSRVLRRILYDETEETAPARNGNKAHEPIPKMEDEQGL